MKAIGSRVISAVLAASLGVLAGAPAGACGWRLFPTVDPEPSGNQLVGAAGTTPNDLWEVGAAFHKLRSSGYALHWNGARWTTFREMDPDRHGGQFSGVAAIARDDVWTVGQRNAAPRYGARRAVAEHWNGSHFTVAPLPPRPGSETFLYGVAALGASDIWSVGGSLAAHGLQRPYVVHWDGSAWRESEAAAVARAATNLDAVTAVTPHDVWSVGGFRSKAGAPFRALAEHWDGARWRIVATPNVSAKSNVLNAVVAVASNDVWALGDYDNGKAFAPLAEHWNGSAWRIVRAPNSGARTAFLLGAAAVSAHDVWAVGEIAEGHGRVESLILRWNGTRWRRVASPNVAHQPVTLLNGAAALPGGTVLAVGGDAGASSVIDTVTEIHRCPKESAVTRR